MRQHEHVKHHSGRATSTVSPLVCMVSHACLRTHETRGAWPAIGAASRRMPNAIYLSIGYRPSESSYPPSVQKRGSVLVFQRVHPLTMCRL